MTKSSTNLDWRAVIDRRRATSACRNSIKVLVILFQVIAHLHSFVLQGLLVLSQDFDHKGMRRVYPTKHQEKTNNKE